MKICVLIPAYNESEKLKSLIPQLQKFDTDVLVVDDGSQDKTDKIAEDLGAMVLRHERNSGKGKALQTGFKFIIEKGYDAVITMDADLQHDVCNIPDFVRVYSAGGSDIILGDRMLETSSMPVVRLWTNKVTSRIISSITGCRMRDTQSGFRLIKRSVLEKVKLSTSRFDTESEVLIKALAKGFRVSSVPVRTIYFDDHKSKIKPLVDTLRFIRLIFKAVFAWKSR